MLNFTRRRLFEDSVMLAAALQTRSLVFAKEEVQTAAADKVTGAIIGCGIRGKQHAKELAKLPDCDIAYVCDPDLDRADEVAKILVDLGRPEPKKVQDLRRVYDDKSIDVIFVATPNHWHALASIWAMQAGKDVYCEKPVSHNVAEGRRIVQTARKLNRVCQTGTQNRTRPALEAAIEYMHGGKLGEVKLARSVLYGNRESIGGPGPCQMPPRCDYNLWAGPASDKPLTRPKFHYDWHWFWDTGNGEIGNNNIHSIDICRWGLNIKGLAQSVVSFGGRFGYADAADTPNTQVAFFDFGDKAIISETRGLKSDAFFPGIKSMWFFYGSEGIIADNHLYDLDGKLVKAFPGEFSLTDHFANFLDVVKSRKVSDLAADIEEGHLSTSLCHLANISYRLGKPASLDSIEHELDKVRLRREMLETLDRTRQHLTDNQVELDKTLLILGEPLRLIDGREEFDSNDAANALLSRTYREPFRVPSEAEIG